MLRRKVSKLCWKIYWHTHALLHKPEPFLSDEQRAHWEKNGYLVLPGHFSKAQVDAVNSVVDDRWSRSRNHKSDTVADIFVDTPRYKRVKMHDAPADARSLPYKMNDLFLESDAVRKLALEERLSRALFEILTGHPLLCNSLNLEFGSQQEFHTDSLYMTPPVGLNLAASWVALEDTHPDAGPLRYYPGSHLIAPYRFSTGRMTAVDAEMDAYRVYMRKQVAELGLKEETFCGKAGDVFIWHSQLFHGGSAIRNPKLTRKSIVFHYFRTADLPARHRRHSEDAFFMKREPQPVPASV